MKNAEWIIKKKIPFNKLSAFLIDSESVDVTYRDEPMCFEVYSIVVYSGGNIAETLGLVKVESPSDGMTALLTWLDQKHKLVTDDESDFLKKMLSAVNRDGDPTTTVRWYISNIDHSRMLQIEDANHRAILTLCLKDTSINYQFNGMVQDQRYTLKELGLYPVNDSRFGEGSCAVNGYDSLRKE